MGSKWYWDEFGTETNFLSSSIIYGEQRKTREKYKQNKN